MNVDASATWRLPCGPVAGAIFQRWLAPQLSPRIVFGDILHGLALVIDRAHSACAPHMREHLWFEELRTGLLCTRSCPLLSQLRAALGNSQHLWFGNYGSIASLWAEAGSVGIRRAGFNDLAKPAFAEVEDVSRCEGYLGLECRKRA